MEIRPVYSEMCKHIIPCVFLVFVRICKCENVGTVLFTEVDAMKTCWADDNVALLSSRMVLQDLIPTRNVITMRDSANAAVIVEYFQMIFDQVRRNLVGRARRVMFLALSDIAGGYMSKVVLPIARHAFYFGDINYQSLVKLYKLLDEVKAYLRTNGEGWAKPITRDLKGHPPPEPIVVSAKKLNLTVCEELTYSENKQGGVKAINIPLPFFDSVTEPTAIALPYKKNSMRNIHTKDGVYALVKYYIVATQCLIAKNASIVNRNHFNNNFYAWLKKEVIPHLEDDNYYSAFGSIYRLLATLRQQGVGERSIENPLGGFNMFNRRSNDVSEDVAEEEEKKAHLEPIKTTLFDKPTMIAILVLSILFFLLIIFLLCCYVRMTNRKKCGCKDETALPVAKNPSVDSLWSSQRSDNVEIFSQEAQMESKTKYGTIDDVENARVTRPRKSESIYAPSGARPAIAERKSRSVQQVPCSGYRTTKGRAFSDIAPLQRQTDGYKRNVQQYCFCRTESLKSVGTTDYTSTKPETEMTSPSEREHSDSSSEKHAMEGRSVFALSK